MSRKNAHLITGILEKLSQADTITYQKHPQEERWLLYVSIESQDLEQFTIEIFLEGYWISFTSLLMRNVTGGDLAIFYESIALLSSYLNGLKVSLDPGNDFITLQSEIDIHELNDDQKESVIYRSIKLFYAFYTEYYPQLIRLAARLSLQYKLEQSSEGKASWLVRNLINSVPDPKLMKTRLKI